MTNHINYCIMFRTAKWPLLIKPPIILDECGPIRESSKTFRGSSEPFRGSSETFRRSMPFRGSYKTFISMEIIIKITYRPDGLAGGLIKHRSLYIYIYIYIYIFLLKKFLRPAAHIHQETLNSRSASIQGLDINYILHIIIVDIKSMV